MTSSASPAWAPLPALDARANSAVSAPPSGFPSSCPEWARMSIESIKQRRHCDVWARPAVLALEGCPCSVMATSWKGHHFVAAAFPHRVCGIAFVGNDDFQFLGNARKRRGEEQRMCQRGLARCHKSGKNLIELWTGGVAYCRLPVSI